MKKNRLLEILSGLIVIILVVLSWRLYLYEVDKNSVVKTYAMTSYETSIEGFTFINSVIENDTVYLLYHDNDYYLLKEIDTLTNKETTYSYNIDSTCHLQNENSYPYIYCADNDTIEIYTVHFKNILSQSINSNYNYALNTIGNLNFRIIDNSASYEYTSGYYQKTTNSYVTLDTPYIKEAYCKDDCLLVKYNNLTELTSLYHEDTLLETNILAYQTYANGIVTYNNNKIRIYNLIADDYKEFNSPINSLASSLIAIGANDYYLYILDGKVINVYNMYSEENFTNIALDKITERINKITVIGNNLYLYGTNTLYVYDIAEIESGNYSSSADYENNLIDSKIAYYKDTYGVTVNLDDPSSLSDNYNIKAVSNYNDIIDALEELERYFIVFNKEFFKRFSDYGMSGLEIYFASSISPVGQNEFSNADVVGLYTSKNNKYNIVISLNSGENITTIAYHETIHAVEDYLSSLGFNFSNWNDLNPDGFAYSNIYYTNQVFSDTIDNNKYNNQIYFVDNYARSNAFEDRARTFEYICEGEDFAQYPHLHAKVNYIKQVLLQYFPELYGSSYFY